ncbi:MAG TPA: hypothetical protein VFH78_11170, partial [Candidatus Thermoplasmatota archaeon]|nr:hypothetical protein [Candidatus Thermoplasmatota archaeon]
MNPADSLLAVALVALCAHVGILFVALARGLMPQRRHPDRLVALLAGAAALAGELLALGALLGRPSPLAWVVGL